MHPFPVAVYFGDERIRAYVADESGSVPGPGVQVPTASTEAQLTSNFRVRAADLHQAARQLGTDLPFLINVACQASPENYSKRLLGLAAAAGRPTLEPGLADVLNALKRSIDDAQALGPRAISAAAMSYLVRPATEDTTPYGTLVDHVNRVLVNPGQNPRSAPPAPPIAGIQDIAAEGIQLWWVKEGSATIVFQVLVPLTGGRPAVRFVLNVAKDRTAAADSLRHTFASLVELYRVDRSRVMEAFGCKDVPVETWRGPVSAAVLAGEWFDGHELHVYEDSSQLYVWMDQRMGRGHPIPPEASDRIWEQVTQMRARYTRITPDGLKPIATHVNAGDYIVRPRPDGDWDLLLIWLREPPLAVRPGDYLVLAGMLGGVNVFGSEQGQTVWWDQPERALKALRSGLADAGLDENAIDDLLQQAHDRPFTEFATCPERVQYSPLISTADPGELRRVFGRAKAELARHLARRRSGTA